VKSGSWLQRGMARIGGAKGGHEKVEHVEHSGLCKEEGLGKYRTGYLYVCS